MLKTPQILQNRKIFCKTAVMVCCAFLAIAGIFQCKGTPGAHDLAQVFMQTYYVDADLKNALSISSGLAQVKIQNQIDLGGGQVDTTAKAERKVVVHSHAALDGAEPMKGSRRKEAFYQVDIYVGQKTPMIRMVRLTMEPLPRLANAPPEDPHSISAKFSPWKVVNFVEVAQ